jgi:hypothetical protein
MRACWWRVSRPFDLNRDMVSGQEMQEGDFNFDIRDGYKMIAQDAEALQ